MVWRCCGGWRELVDLHLGAPPSLAPLMTLRYNFLHNLVLGAVCDPRHQLLSGLPPAPLSGRPFPPTLLIQLHKCI